MEKQKCTLAAMDQKQTICIKEEETDQACNELGSVVKVYPSSVNIKQELEDCVNQEIPEDPLKIEEPGLHIRQDPELKQDADDSEHSFVDDPLGISCSTNSIKEDPELVLEADGTENIVAASTRYASDSARLLKHRHESCVTSFEETVTQGEVHNEQKVAAEESTHSTMFCTHTQSFISEKDRLLQTNLKCSLRGKELITFRCSICLQIFTSKYRLTMHVFIHMDGVKPPIHVCKSCGEVFSSDVSLNKHLKMIEGDHASFAVHREKFVSTDEKEDIVLKGNQEVPVMEETGKQSASKESWEISEKSCNEICNTQSMTHYAMKQDRHDHYGNLSTTGNFSLHTDLLTTKQLHKYDACGKSYTQLGNLKNHELMYRGTRPHKCDFCSKSFALLHNLNSHLLIHTGKRPHKCDICSKSFIHLGNLKMHSLIHTGMRPHKCDICSKSFIHLGNLKTHLLIHTGTRPHKCDICGKSFTHLCNLKMHSLIHTGMRPHKCEICSKSFTRLHNLKSHLLIHTGMRPYKCDICNKSFSRSNYLKSHFLIHTGMRPHKCEICSKAFTRLNNLKRHLLIHTGTRPHKCDICGKSFTQLGSLKKHLLIHTGTRQHKFDICDKSFTQLGNIKSHV